MQSTAAHAAATTIQPAAACLFGSRGESACGWYGSSLDLRDGLAVRELSDRELLALWMQARGSAAMPALN